MGLAPRAERGVVAIAGTPHPAAGTTCITDGDTSAPRYFDVISSHGVCPGSLTVMPGTSPRVYHFAW